MLSTHLPRSLNLYTCPVYFPNTRHRRVSRASRPFNKLEGKTTRSYVLPFDLAWAPSLDQESLAPGLFASSLFPYIGFLYYLTRSNKAPRLMLFGFYFLLVFVGVSIPAGIYAKVHYGTSLSNVDWLHGGAEVFLCITNFLIVLGLRQGIREAQSEEERPGIGDKDSM